MSMGCGRKLYLKNHTPLWNETEQEKKFQKSQKPYLCGLKMK